jgi:hypothetical protein
MMEYGHRIFVYCDDASHPRRVAVTNFIFRDPGWGEEFTRKNGTDHGTTIGPDDAPFRLSDHDDPTAGLRSGSFYRSRYALTCRKCKRRPLVLREEKLFSLLDDVAGTGVSEVSLGALVAILTRQSQDRPELEQG